MRKPQRPRGKSTLQRMREQLAGGEFRQFNHKLYTCTSAQAAETLRSDPSLLERYVHNFKQQTMKWPSQPVHQAIGWLLKFATHQHVCDMGAGDGELAAHVSHRHSVVSFDLVSINKYVTACDIASLPLDDAQQDVCVLCLALMGTNYNEFLAGTILLFSASPIFQRIIIAVGKCNTIAWFTSRSVYVMMSVKYAEATRVLRKGGYLYLAEVRSRLESDAGTLEAFIEGLHRLGLEMAERPRRNRMFVTFILRKRRRKPPERLSQVHFPLLKACEYQPR